MANQYSLESVLKVRYEVEEQRLEVMTKSLRYYQKNLEIAKKTEHEIEKNINTLKTTRENNIVNEKAMYLYLEKMRNDLEQQQKSVKNSELIYEHKKTDYFEAHKDRKIIEKHKEKFLHNLKEKFKKIEDNMNNELAIAAFVRKDGYR